MDCATIERGDVTCSKTLKANNYIIPCWCLCVTSKGTFLVRMVKIANIIKYNLKKLVNGMLNG